MPRKSSGRLALSHHSCTGSGAVPAASSVRCSAPWSMTSPPTPAGMLGKSDTVPATRIRTGVLLTGTVITEPTCWPAWARNELVASTGSVPAECSQLITALSAPVGVPFGPAGNRVVRAGSACGTGAASARNSPPAVLATRTLGHG